MHRLRNAFLAFLLLVPVSAFATQRGDEDWLYRGSDIARDPAWRFGTLPNGLRYAVRRNRLPAGQVSIRIRIDAGSLNEADNERGWAHFVEHMLFRGTENFPDHRAREIWQQLGASFGSDSNAFTRPTETLYVLNLPHATREPLDTSLSVLAEMMMRARFDPAAVQAERPVVLAEKGRQPEINVRFQELSSRLFYGGLRFGVRDPIGTDETLNAATAEGLRDFYRRWYRPERATVIMAGDADPDMMEALIRARFGGWQGTGTAPAEPGPGEIAEPRPAVASMVYPGTPTAASIAWMRPYENLPHTRERERLFLEESLALQILNRRLEAHARGQSAFLNAGAGITRWRRIANATGLSVVARDGAWRPALAEAYGIIADALRAPPSEGEIARELANLRTAIAAAQQGNDTVLSQARADQLAGAIDSGAVVATPATVRENFEVNARLMTPAAIEAAMQRLFQGSGPRMILVSPQPIEGGETALAQGLAAAEVAAPATRPAERQFSLDALPAPAGEGREVSRRRIDDLDVTLVRFANGSTLTFKHTEFERGAVQVQFRFGNGLAGLPPDRPSLAWLSGLVAPSGLGDLDLDALERLLTGHRMGLAFAVDEDAFVLGGATSAGDLYNELRLLTAKLIAPRWDPALFARFRAAAVESFNLHYSSASARASREMGGVLRPNDQRWRPIDLPEMEHMTVDQFRDYFAPLLAAGPVHVVIVGDLSLDRATEVVRRTVGALPRREEPPLPANASLLLPPAPDPEPRRFTHQGDPNQAFALIGWSTLGGIDRMRDRRALGVAANIFSARLFDRLREAEGATYAPNAVQLSADSFENWGVFYASAEIRPTSTAAFFRAAREIVADLAARPASAEEFARTQNPILAGIERRIASNAYWVDVIADFDRRPRAIENVRHYLADYRALTPEDVRRAVAAYVTDQGDWSMLVLPARGAAEANGQQ